MVKQGRFRNEIVESVFDTSTYTNDNFEGFFKDRVLIITNKSIFFVEINNNKLINRIKLGQINGMMFYFQDNKSNSIVLETTKGIFRIETGLPELNLEIRKELKVKLEQISNLHSVAKKVKNENGPFTPVLKKENYSKLLEQPYID